MRIFWLHETERIPNRQVMNMAHLSSEVPAFVRRQRNEKGIVMNDRTREKISTLESQKNKNDQVKKKRSEFQYLASIRLLEAGFPPDMAGHIYMTAGAYGDECLLTVTSPSSLHGHTREEILNALEALQNAGCVGKLNRVSFYGYAPSVVHGNVAKTLTHGQRLDGTALTTVTVTAIQPIAMRVDTLGVKVKVPLSLEGFPSLTLNLPSSLEEFSDTFRLSGYVPSRGKYAREKYLELPEGRDHLCPEGASLDVQVLPSPNTSAKGSYNLTWSAEREMTPAELFGAAFCSGATQKEEPEDSSGMSMGG